MASNGAALGALADPEVTGNWWLSADYLPSNWITCPCLKGKLEGTFPHLPHYTDIFNLKTKIRLVPQKPILSPVYLLSGKSTPFMYNSETH